MTGGSSDCVPTAPGSTCRSGGAQTEAELPAAADDHRSWSTSDLCVAIGCHERAILTAESGGQRATAAAMLTVLRAALRERQ